MIITTLLQYYDIIFTCFILFQDETLYMDRDSQIQAIEKTFQDAKIPIEKHYSKPNLVPVEVLPIFPDFKVKLESMITF